MEFLSRTSHEQDMMSSPHTISKFIRNKWRIWIGRLTMIPWIQVYLILPQSHHHSALFRHNTTLKGHATYMTTRSTANLSPSPQLHARSSSSPNQQFPTPRPPLPGTPNRDGRSRTSNSVIQSLNGSASKTDVLTYDNFNEIIIQKCCPLSLVLTLESAIHCITINLLD